MHSTLLLINSGVIQVPAWTVLVCARQSLSFVLPLQTLYVLHRQARIAHMDLTSTNVMALDSADPWDDIRLIDFGLAGLHSMYAPLILVLLHFPLTFDSLVTCLKSFERIMTQGCAAKANCVNLLSCFAEALLLHLPSHPCVACPCTVSIAWFGEFGFSVSC